jgi:DNA repair and recombination protein RAD52
MDASDSLTTAQERRAKRARIEAHVRKHIPPQKLAKRVGAAKMTLTYVETHTVIEHLNEVFGCTQWSHTVKRLEPIGDRGWLCVVTLRVRDIDMFEVEHDGVGWGTGSDQEKAVKEAESDAIKRAARCLGNYFGNSLYDKEHLREIDTQVKK